MSSSGSIKVGSFKLQCNDGSYVPQRFQNASIWYSDKLGYFLVADSDNKPMRISDTGKPVRFDMEQFSKFVDIGAINFAGNGIENHMMMLLDEWEHDNDSADDGEDASAYDDSTADDGYYDEPDNDYDYYDSNDAPVSSQFQNAENINRINVKDPTKHTVLFFVITLLISLIIAFALNFGDQVIAIISSLLT